MFQMKNATMPNFLIFSIFVLCFTHIFFALTLKSVNDTMLKRRNENLEGILQFKEEFAKTSQLDTIQTNLKYLSVMSNSEELNFLDDQLTHFGDSLEKLLKVKVKVKGNVGSKKAAIKEATKFAWDNYKKYAWGKDELHPISRTGKSWMGLGLTIIDSIDTLWIMGLKEEYEDAKNFIRDLNLEVDYSASLFEMNIRILGGLLSCYSLTKEQMFLDKSIKFGDILIQVKKKKKIFCFYFKY